MVYHGMNRVFRFQYNMTAFFLFTSFVIVVTFSFEVCYFGISVLSSRLVFVSSPFSLE